MAEATRWYQEGPGFSRGLSWYILFWSYNTWPHIVYFLADTTGWLNGRLAWMKTHSPNLCKAGSSANTQVVGWQGKVTAAERVLMCL